MIIRIPNPLDLFKAKHYDHPAEREKFLNSIPKIATPEQPATPVENPMANEFVSILETIGKDAEKVGEYLLADAVKYLPFAATLAGFIFPPAVAPLDAANAVADLLQNSVASAEILLAKASLTGDVGPQKLATVLQIVTGAVTTLLATPTITADLKAVGITVNTTYITGLVNAVVAFLNLQGVVTTTAPATLPSAA